jgi:hypothetical protein
MLLLTARQIKFYEKYESLTTKRSLQIIKFMKLNNYIRRGMSTEKYKIGAQNFQILFKIINVLS